ncbi:MAG TPA: sigma-70 family RNA polymerase sigma factor [Bacteroidia bacterium]|nr:sigma-70 family RNA polymerase sigma factor [Bacteroidia bacterium]
MRFFPRKRTNDRSDEELLEAYRNSGNKNYVGELYIRYSHLVYGLCLKYFRDRERARDAVLQIFEKMFQSLKTTRPENFKAWLTFVARNFCISELRRLKVKQERNELFVRDEIANYAGDEESVEKALQKESKLERLDEAIRGLDDEQRTCIELFYLQDKSYREIAAVTGFTEKQVKSYLQNGKRNLKLMLDQRS